MWKGQQRQSSATTRLARDPRQTHVLLQTLDLGQAVMAQIQLFQADQTFQVLHLGNSI